jgi:hypothetical protein
MGIPVSKTRDEYKVEHITMELDAIQQDLIAQDEKGADTLSLDSIAVRLSAVKATLFLAEQVKRIADALDIQRMDKAHERRLSDPGS